MSENTSGVFIHGVASGDPLQDRVIIWTRVTTASNEPVQVNWKMGRDRNFNGLVASGTALAESDADFTVKVDVTGLDPGTHYFYQFAALGQTSPVGRTKTLPPDGTKHLRFAQVSCARYDAELLKAIPHIKWCDLDSHGYNIMDVTPAQVTAEWRFVDTVLQPSDQEMSGASFMVKAGCPQLMAIESVK